MIYLNTHSTTLEVKNINILKFKTSIIKKQKSRLRQVTDWERYFQCVKKKKKPSVQNEDRNTEEKRKMNAWKYLVTRERSVGSILSSFHLISLSVWKSLFCSDAQLSPP